MIGGRYRATVKVTAKATAAVLASAGLLSTALTACASDRAPLACSVQVSSAAPVQGSNELVTVKTAAGAKVVMAAQFRTSEPVRVTTADTAGIARITYAIGNAAAGYPVRVTAGASRNGANGSCTNTFTVTGLVTGPTLSAVFNQTGTASLGGFSAVIPDHALTLSFPAGVTVLGSCNAGTYSGALSLQ